MPTCAPGAWARRRLGQLGGTEVGKRVRLSSWHCFTFQAAFFTQGTMMERAGK